MSIKIRPAVIADAKYIHGLVRELAKYEQAEEELWLTESDYVNFLDEDRFECHVATHNEQIVGMILFYPTFSTWKGPMLHLEDFIVTQSYRNQGIGKLLFDHLIDLAKQRNVTLIKWEVLNWNTPAIEFYKKYPTLFETNWWNVKLLLKSK